MKRSPPLALVTSEGDLFVRKRAGKVAEFNNVPPGAFGGAITAALYLKEFVPNDVPWAHFDMMAWNNSSRPGRPEGGEAQVARAIYRTIADRFGK